jgi:hypothetical protein
MTRATWVLPALAFASALLAWDAQGQSLSSGTIGGVAKDESGAVLPGVTSKREPRAHREGSHRRH